MTCKKECKHFCEPGAEQDYREMMAHLNMGIQMTLEEVIDVLEQNCYCDEDFRCQFEDIVDYLKKRKKRTVA